MLDRSDKSSGAGGFLVATPLLLIPIAIYSLVGLTGPIERPFVQWNTVSGDTTFLTYGNAIILLGVICLGVEIIKAGIVTAASVIDNALSLILAMLAWIAYIAVGGFGSATFLVLATMQTVDAIGGTIVARLAAKRDFSVG